jgi:hypothetical protein
MLLGADFQQTAFTLLPEHESTNQPDKNVIQLPQVVLLFVLCITLILGMV